MLLFLPGHRTQDIGLGPARGGGVGGGVGGVGGGVGGGVSINVAN